MPTLSIVARCPKTLELGICVATGVPYVRRRVPFVKAGVGVVATQGFTETSYGVDGLKMLARGVSPEDALRALLEEDPLKQLRQVAMMDSRGGKSVFTGAKTPSWRGHRVGENYVVAGNLLANERVVSSAASAFEETRGRLMEKLLNAIEAGERAGGDKRGLKSVALVVADRFNVTVDLSVDESSDPIGQLRRLISSRIKMV